MHLPDVNVWLALAFGAHAHHQVAREWFAVYAEDGCAFCLTTQQDFLRLATHPAAFGDEAVSCEGAWRLYDAFFADGRIRFAHEPSGLGPVWRGLSGGSTRSPKAWTDSYLAAFAQVSGMQLVTMDRAFRQYPGLRCCILE